MKKLFDIGYWTFSAYGMYVSGRKPSWYLESGTMEDILSHPGISDWDKVAMFSAGLIAGGGASEHCLKRRVCSRIIRETDCVLGGKVVDLLGVDVRMTGVLDTIDRHSAGLVGDEALNIACGMASDTCDRFDSGLEFRKCLNIISGEGVDMSRDELVVKALWALSAAAFMTYDWIRDRGLDSMSRFEVAVHYASMNCLDCCPDREAALRLHVGIISEELGRYVSGEYDLVGSC